MSQFAELIQNYGVVIVFGVVLLEQIGLPLPAFPILVAAGALAVDGDLSWPLCLAAGVLACLACDLFWFRAGRSHGKRILNFLCKISLSPDSCVSQTEDRFRRFGPKALLVSKFVPGFNTVAAPLSGAIGTPMPRFLGFAVPGAVLWIGSGLALGAYFHKSVDSALDAIGLMGSTALMVVAGLLGLFVLFKYAERRRFRRMLAIPRIGIDELRALIDGGHDPVLVDARSLTAQQLQPAIPGALMYVARESDRLFASLDKERPVVVYCSCPNDVTAAAVAKQFLANGFQRARPLHGGLDAWMAHAGGRSAPVPDTVPGAAC
jgi:membrane protein DedA with SNARE-associated domain/rhodanese-related sulfurtransferase